HADEDDELAVIDVGLRHGCAVAADEVSLLLRLALKHSIHPKAREKRAHIPADSRPQWLIIRLENHPLRGLLDRLFGENEESPDVHIFPVRIWRRWARAPDKIAAAG